MAVTRAELLQALAGSGQLMRFNADGIRQLNTSWQGARRSFWAAVLTLPVFIFLNWRTHDSAGMSQVGTLTYAAVEIVCYALQWSVLPVALYYLCNIWQRQARYPAIVAALNWLTVWQSLVYVLLGLLSSSNLLPLPLLNALMMVAVIYLIAIEGFTARVALQISSWGAVGVILLDLLVTWQIATTRTLLLVQ